MPVGRGPAAGWARAEAPPTVANVGPGFDVLGLAVPAPGDVVHARATPGPSGVTLEVRGDGGRLPRASGRNSASVAATRLLEILGSGAGLELVLHKRLPTGGSGLGSSGASSAAAVAAAAAAIGEDPDPGLLLEAAAAGEEAACGSAHRDNVAPALLGGLVLLPPGGAVVRLPCPDVLGLALVTPDAEVPTAAARAALPAAVPVATAVAQAAGLAALVHALHTGDVDLAGRALVDRIAAPARAHLLPGYERVRDAARAAGAVGASMSGSGPSVFALCRRGGEAPVAEAMRRAFAEVGVGARVVHAGPLAGPGALASVRLDAQPGAG